MKIDLVVVTYKPDKEFLEMVNLLENQSLPINKTIIVNVEQKYLERIMYDQRFLEKHNNIEIRNVSKMEFDCGKSRNLGVSVSDADFFLMMAQDAMPVGKDFVKTLLDPFLKDSAIAVSYARQIAREEDGPIAQAECRYFFPEVGHVYSDKEFNTFGTDTYFLSNGAALYRRDYFDKLGGFINHAIANEDILFGAAAINAGLKIAYVPEAVAIHSENLTPEDHEKRSFDMGVSHAKHPEVFSIDQEKEIGRNLYRITVDQLEKSGNRRKVAEYNKITNAKKKGYKLGRKYKRLPMSTILKYTCNKEYWNMDEILRARTAVDVHSGYGKSTAEINMIKDVPKRKIFDK